MEYNFLDNSVDRENIKLENSEAINKFLLKNNYAEIIKGIDFFATDEKFLYVHGFLGTGKRQYINYITEFLNKDVIKLEYYCKASTVCDDILLSFISAIERKTQNNNSNLNVKITTLAVKFSQFITSVKKPFVVILHSYDDISEENQHLVTEMLRNIFKNSNVKVLLSTRAMIPDVLGDIKPDRKIFLKGFSKDIFKEYLYFNKVECTDTAIEDFYKYTRGYYYYTALSIKIIQAMKLSLHEFLEKYTLSGVNFDSYLGITYINLIPDTIRNFFWFLRTIRHGMSLNALAILELYDEFSITYLKSNLMIFQVDEILYVQDYFQQNIDISIPAKTLIKLHKFIINIYEKELKEPLNTRAIMISRQAFRAEIEYHNNCIKELENKNETQKQENTNDIGQVIPKQQEEVPAISDNLDKKIKNVKKLEEEKKYTEAIEEYLRMINSNDIDDHNKVEFRISIGKLYKEIADYSKAQHYYELAENYYKKTNEVINLNYLYYDLTDLYFLMYKNERAIETIKKVIYSVDTPRSLMVDACTLLGNIYTDNNNPDEAYRYYQKALESLDVNTSEDTKAELYFKYALASDDKNDIRTAFEYYMKCISINKETPYKVLAYSNLGSCYYDNENYADALDCFSKAYEIEKSNNNFDGIYYNAQYLAKIYIKTDSPRALDYLIEAKQSAEFLNENFYMLEASIALGDYYYDDPSKNKEALKEYLYARTLIDQSDNKINASKIDERIQDMKLRMDEKSFNEIAKKYE